MLNNIDFTLEIVVPMLFSKFIALLGPKYVSEESDKAFLVKNIRIAEKPERDFSRSTYFHCLHEHFLNTMIFFKLNVSFGAGLHLIVVFLRRVLRTPKK